MYKQWSIFFLIAALIAISAIGRSQAQSAPDQNNNASSGRQFVQNMVDGEFAVAAAHFDTRVSQAMSPAQLQQAWKGLIKQCGEFKQIGGVRSESEAGYNIVYVDCQFNLTTIDTKVVYDKDGKIGGLWFVPHIDANDALYSAPSSVKPDRFVEKEVNIGSGEWRLPGTLTIPKGDGPFPAVVLVHGSGPNDRDETIGPNKPFRDLAWGLASQGIAVLRYDKRTKVYPEKIVKSIYSLTVKEEFIDDSLAAVAVLRASERIAPKRIFVLGHSLGGMLIPRIGKADPNIAGLIVMAGPTRPFQEIILDQMNYLSSLNGPTSPEAQRQIADMRRQVEIINSKNLAPSTPQSARLYLNAPATYWLDLRRYNPTDTAKSIAQPMLILQGDRDYQVTPDNFDRWKTALSGRENVTFKLYPKLNHLFIAGEGKSTPQEYEKHGSLSKNVIDDIAAWVNSH
jgi:fermentation-respiration switch protein FrsA (DUF1100 family)